MGTFRLGWVVTLLPEKNYSDNAGGVSVVQAHLNHSIKAVKTLTILTSNGIRENTMESRFFGLPGEMKKKKKDQN